MVDVSGSLVWQDGPGNFAYALITPDGKIWDWTAAPPAWVPMPATFDPKYLRSMQAHVWGTMAWSQSIVSTIDPQSQVLASVWEVDAKGQPITWAGSAIVADHRGGITIFNGR